MEICWREGVSAHKRALFYPFWLETVKRLCSASLFQCLSGPRGIVPFFGAYLNYLRQTRKTQFPHKGGFPEIPGRQVSSFMGET